MTICGQCGKHTNYREPTCDYCGKDIHAKDCPRDRTCLCHAENLKAWDAKKPQENVADVDGKKPQDSEKTT